MNLTNIFSVIIIYNQNINVYSILEENLYENIIKILFDQMKTFFFLFVLYYICHFSTYYCSYCVREKVFSYFKTYVTVIF